MLPFLRDPGQAPQKQRGPALARLRRSSALFEPKIDQRASTNVRSWKKFVRENLKRIIFECSNIRCSSTHLQLRWFRPKPGARRLLRFARAALRESRPISILLGNAEHLGGGGGGGEPDQYIINTKNYCK